MYKRPPLGGAVRAELGADVEQVGLAVRGQGRVVDRLRRRDDAAGRRGGERRDRDRLELGQRGGRDRGARGGRRLVDVPEPEPPPATLTITSTATTTTTSAMATIP